MWMRILTKVSIMQSGDVMHAINRIIAAAIVYHKIAYTNKMDTAHINHDQTAQDLRCCDFFGIVECAVIPLIFHGCCSLIVSDTIIAFENRNKINCFVKGNELLQIKNTYMLTTTCIELYFIT